MNDLTILLATQNQGKLKELKNLLIDLPIKIVSPSEIALGDLDVNETGSTFHENALLKAQAFADASNLPSLADDSGLEVFDLKGFPGVISARWTTGSPSELNEKLLNKLANTNNRTARFFCVLCLAEPKPSKNHYFFEGEVRGKIAHSQLGDSGFGYDPIFIPLGKEITFGQMNAEDKDKISHRAKALENFKKYLTKKFN